MISMKTTARAVLAVSATAAIVGVTAACGSGGGSGDVSLRLDFVHTGKDAIWTYGVEQGFFSDEGIDLDILDGKGSGTTAQTVSNGSDDFGIMDSGTAITVAAEGLPIRGVASVFDQSPVTILSPADAALTTPEDLEGKSVAVTSGDGPSILLPALLDANGVDESSLNLVNMQPQAKLTSLLSGDVDAVSTISLVEVALEQQGMDIHSMPYRDFGVETPGYYLATSTSYLEKNRDRVEGFVRATQKSIEATLADPDAAIDSFMDKYSDYDREQAEAELAVMLPLIMGPGAEDHPTGWIDMDLAESTTEVLEEFGDVKDPEPVEDYLTNEFVSD